jgi:hypothetical protein
MKNDLGKAFLGYSGLRDEIRSSSDFRPAKLGDRAAADRLVKKAWRPIRTTRLSEELKPNSVLLTQPSSSRLNTIPIALANHLADSLPGRLSVEVVISDSFISADHTRASKEIPRNQRVFEKREFSLLGTELPLELFGKNIVLVDDTVTSGGSVRWFSEFLADHGLKVDKVIGLMGESRLTLDQKTEDRFSQILAEKKIPVDIEKLNHLTRTEVGSIIRLLNNTRSIDGIKKITERIQGLQRSGNAQGLTEGFYGLQGGRSYPDTDRDKLSPGDKGREKTDPGDVKTSERLQGYRSSSTIKKFTTILRGINEQGGKNRDRSKKSQEYAERVLKAVKNASLQKQNIKIKKTNEMER